MTNTRKILAIVMAIAICVSMFSHTVFATEEIANGTAGDGITWVLDSDGTLTISGEGEIVVDWYAPPWKDYNESITAVVVEEGITKIPNTAFCYAENLITVSLPSTLTYISGWAFYDNFTLEEINVADANTAYKSNDGILFTEDEKTLVAYPMNKACEEYTIPASVTTIGEMAFVDCVAVDKVIVLDTVTTLADFAFGYSQIKEVEIGNGVMEIPYRCFQYSYVEKVVISDSVETISERAFSTANHLNTLIIGSGIKTINEKSFNKTESLEIIHYNGTQADWDAISINEENADLNSKELHFITGEIKEGTEPTCADGHTAGYYCDDCEAYLTGEAIPAVDEHDYDDGVVYGPYCTASGYTLYTCTVCGDGYTDNETEMVGHTIGNDGLCEVCGEECTHADEKIDGKCDYCGLEFDYEEIYFEEINTVHIPEEHVPVIVKFTSTINGWLVLVSDNGGDDENNDPYVEVYDSNGDYVEDDDDHDYNDSLNFYCEFEAQAGETYYIALYSYDSDVEYDYIITKHVDIDHQPTAAEPYVTLTWDVDAEYQWYLLDNDDEVAIEGETEATLQNPVIGSSYGCLVTYNGFEIYSYAFVYGYAITHQPTADEPYVELNDDTDAKYQWYSAVEKTVEITDENADTCTYNDMTSSYDAETGWTGATEPAYYDETLDYYVFFETELKAGDTVEIRTDGLVDNFIGLGCNDYYYGEYATGVENDTYTITVKQDGTYYLYCWGEPGLTVKAYIADYEYTAIDGATEDEFTPTEEGIYACKVTFADDSTEMSKVFEYAIADDDNDNDDANNNSGNAGSTTDPNKGNTTGDKKPVKPEIPNTDATASNVWFALLIMSAMGIVLIMTSNKKKAFTK